MRIYTRTGDSGQTALFGGERIDKDSCRIDAYGTTDELSAAVGYAIAINGNADELGILADVQRHLFVIGADLATPQTVLQSTATASIPRLGDQPAKALEREIDRIATILPELKSFILPGGTPGAAALHLARGICRRAERCIVSLNRLEPVNPQILVYVNRLSDYLFMAARLVNHYAGVHDISLSRHSIESDAANT